MAQPTEKSSSDSAANGVADEEEGAAAIVKKVLDKFELKALSAEEQLSQLCLVVNDVCNENARMRTEVANLKQQCEKNEQNTETLQHLITALKTQVELTRTEGDLKVKEETQKRIDCSKQFQNTMSELSTLMEANSAHNAKLRDENSLLAQKLTLLLAQYEEREKKISSTTTELQLQLRLSEAQLAKSKIERAEANAEFTKERLQLHRDLLEARQENDALLDKVVGHKDQIEIYEKQYKELDKNMVDSSQNFGLFRTEMDKLGKKLRLVEQDTQEWRDKFESSNEQVKRMNATALEREKELEAAKKKLGAMEKLNRALQTERAELMKKVNS